MTEQPQPVVFCGPSGVGSESFIIWHIICAGAIGVVLYNIA